MSDGFEGSGISSDEIVELRIWYPSMRAVRGHGIGNGNHRVVILNLVGVRSHTDDTKLMYRLLLDLSNFPNSQPSAFVLSPRDEDIKHVHHDGGRELMAHFNYTMSDVWAEPAQWADYATFEPETPQASPEPQADGAMPSPSPFIYEGFAANEAYEGYARVRSRPSPSPSAD